MFLRVFLPERPLLRLTCTLLSLLTGKAKHAKLAKQHKFSVAVDPKTLSPQEKKKACKARIFAQQEANREGKRERREEEEERLKKKRAAGECHAPDGDSLLIETAIEQADKERKQTEQDDRALAQFLVQSELADEESSEQFDTGNIYDPWVVAGDGRCAIRSLLHQSGIQQVCIDGMNIQLPLGADVRTDQSQGTLAFLAAVGRQVSSRAAQHMIDNPERYSDGERQEHLQWNDAFLNGEKGQEEVLPQGLWAGEGLLRGFGLEFNVGVSVACPTLAQLAGQEGGVIIHLVIHPAPQGRPTIEITNHVQAPDEQNQDEDDTRPSQRCLRPKVPFC